MKANFHQTTSYKKDTQRRYTQPWHPEIWVQCIRRYRFASKLVIGKCCLESRAGDNPAIVTDFSGLSQCFLANAGTAPLFSGHNHLLSKPCYQLAIHWQVVQDYKYTSTLSALWQIWLKLMQCHDVFIFFRKRVRMGTIKLLQQDTSRDYCRQTEVTLSMLRYIPQKDEHSSKTCYRALDWSGISAARTSEICAPIRTDRRKFHFFKYQFLYHFHGYACVFQEPPIISSWPPQCVPQELSYSLQLHYALTDIPRLVAALHACDSKQRPH